MDWLEISVQIDQEAVESVSQLFAEVGYNHGVAIDQPFLGSPDGPEYTRDVSKPVTVRTYVPLDEHAAAVETVLQQGLWALGLLRPVGVLTTRRLIEEDWANAWKVHYPVLRLGEHWVIVPSWLTYEQQAGDQILNLDPGMAFGTGLHPTTQLSLLLLERYTQVGQTALDLGCGSGILAIAMAKRGAANVVAVDNDPIAVEATLINVQNNKVPDTVSVVEGSLGPGSTTGHWLGTDWGTAVRKQHEKIRTSEPTSIVPMGQFDLIAANILANVHVLLAPHLFLALKPGGLLITSGIISDRETEVLAAFSHAGLDLQERRQEGDWIALVHRRADG
ncbi:MAG: 50S ribosomal protein L11 methyltransferase [Herpetosiphon sp.]